MQEQDVQNKKFVTLSFVATAIATFLIVRIFFQSAAVAFSFFGRLWSNQLYQHAIPVTIGIVTFFVLQFQPKVNHFAEEVVIEIGKVVWPTRKETAYMTFVTVIMLLLASIFFGVFDLITTSAFKLLIK